MELEDALLRVLSLLPPLVPASVPLQGRRLLALRYGESEREQREKSCACELFVRTCVAHAGLSPQYVPDSCAPSGYVARLIASTAP